MTLRPQRASDIQPVDLRWLWLNRIPLHVVTAIQGDGGLGKGLITAWMAARLSRGELPGSLAGPQHTLIVSAEDERAAVRGRLRAAGADLDRIDIDDGTELDLVSDLGELITYLRRRHVRLLVLDPLHTIARSVSYDVRRALLSITRTLDVAIVTVNHLNSNRGADARSRGLGGRSLQNLSRATHLLAPHPDDGDATGGLRILAPVKLNRCERPPSLAGRINTVDGQPTWEWIGETDYTADDLLARRRAQPRPTPQLDDAIAFLRRVLRTGPLRATDATRQAVAAGIAMMTLRDAREALGIEPQRVGFGPGSHFEWALPTAPLDLDARALLDATTQTLDEEAPRDGGSPSSARAARPASSAPPPPSPPSPSSSAASPPSRPRPPSTVIDAHRRAVSTNGADTDAPPGNESINGRQADDASTRFSLLELD